jgi:hypothetical protein
MRATIRLREAASSDRLSALAIAETPRIEQAASGKSVIVGAS